MRSLFWRLFVLLIGLFSCSDVSVRDPGNLLARVMIISDPQYGWGRLDSCEYERKNFRQIAEVFNAERFDAMIVLGDLVENHPDELEGRARQVQFLREDLKLINSTAVYLLAGNHDLGEFSPPEPAREFEKDFGFKTWYTFEIGGIKFLALNSTLIKNYYEQDGEYAKQLDFVRKNADARIILVHHPPYWRHPFELGDYDRWPIRQRLEILGSLEQGTHIFSGHTHRSFQRTSFGWNNINVGTCCAPWPKGPRNYGVLEIFQKDIIYTEYVLD